MIIPQSIVVFGEQLQACKISEAAHMATFFNVLRDRYPQYAAIALHIRNERQRTPGQMSKEKSQGGFITGAADIVIPGRITFVCELKSRDKKAKVSKEQISYLVACADVGAFSCVAYGYEAALEAFEVWRKRCER